jgi:hypothetical protein
VGGGAATRPYPTSSHAELMQLSKCSNSTAAYGRRGRITTFSSYPRSSCLSSSKQGAFEWSSQKRGRLRGPRESYLQNKLGADYYEDNANWLELGLAVDSPAAGEGTSAEGT